MSAQTQGTGRQAGRSQLVDALIVLALIFVTLFATTWVVERGSAQPSQSADTQGKAIDELPLTSAERAQYEQLAEQGVVDRETADQQVAANRPSSDKYPISPLLLAGTVLLLLAYLAFVYRASFTEYREVIEAKFGKKGADR